jgi:hypothetical protein
MKKPWTSAELVYLRDHFENENTRVIAQALGRTYGSVADKAEKLGLKKSKEFWKDPQKTGWAALGKEGRDSRFKPGHKPWNKNMKGFDAGGRSHETRFKPGQLSVNAKWDGCISARTDKRGITYLFIRVSLRQWVPLAQAVWIAFKGPIPKGFFVRFKNNNPMDCRIENLLLVDRRQHMVKNSIHNYPPDLVRSILAVNKLRQTIKNVSQNG